MAQEIADSKLLDTWGSSGAKIEPDISKIIEGWQLGEQPPHEYMNWLQNTFGSKLNHILKNGVPQWEDTKEYLAGASVQHSGSIWLCETTNTNSEPTELNANWEKVAINKDLTVTVDTLADLKNISYPAITVWASGYHAKNDGSFGSHIFRLKGVKTTETDNSGTVIIATIGGTDYVYELQYDGPVNVKWFGAKGDGATDDTVAIQNTINFASLNKTANFNSLYKENPVKVIVPDGIYLISASIDITKSHIWLIGEGRPVFKATSAINNTSFIITLNYEATDSGSLYDMKISNISFQRINSNPYLSGYDSSTFGSGAGYNFINSCNGIYVGNVHYSIIENCHFIGLRCGIKQIGSWLFDIKGCNFIYNDRHIYGVNNDGNTSSNNANSIEECVFGSSVMMGGIYLENFDGLSFKDIDVEGTHQSSIMLRSCRHVSSSGWFYIESANKYIDDSGSPSYIYDSTTFMPVNIDINLSKNYVITLSACSNVNLSNILYALSSVGLCLNAYCQDSPVLNNVKATVNTGTNYLFNIAGTTTTGFTTYSLYSSYYHKVVPSNVPFINFADAAAGSSSVPVVWHIDPVNGDDDISTANMSSTNKIKSLNLRAIPAGITENIVINIYSQGGNLVLPLSTPQKISIVGQTGGGVSNVFMGGVKNLNLNSLNITGTIGDNSTFDYSVEEQKNIQLDNCTANIDKGAGLFIYSKNWNVYMNSCTVTQNNSIDYVFVVQKANIWAKNCTFNKKVEVRDFGIFYHKGNTSPSPVVFTGAIGKIEAL